MSEDIGYVSDEVCNRDGCKGIIAEHEVENCSCHISPPCGACTSPRGFCPLCEWEEADDEIEHVEYKGKVWEKPEPRKLDSTKIDWKAEGHTHFSMRKVGVYPEGTLMSEVREKVDGTFGGRFEYFINGKFSFIAYTD